MAGWKRVVGVVVLVQAVAVALFGLHSIEVVQRNTRIDVSSSTAQQTSSQGQVDDRELGRKLRGDRNNNAKVPAAKKKAKKSGMSSMKELTKAKRNKRVMEGAQAKAKGANRRGGSTSNEKVMKRLKQMMEAKKDMMKKWGAKKSKMGDKEDARDRMNGPKRNAAKRRPSRSAGKGHGGELGRKLRDDRNKNAKVPAAKKRAKKSGMSSMKELTKGLKRFKEAAKRNKRVMEAAQAKAKRANRGGGSTSNEKAMKRLKQMMEAKKDMMKKWGAKKPKMGDKEDARDRMNGPKRNAAKHRPSRSAGKGHGGN